MKVLFAARMARFDLLRAAQGLASRVTTVNGHLNATRVSIA